MRVIPVIDLMSGRVVRGVAGARETYRPIESTLVDEPTPVAVAAAFLRLQLPEIYLADLDAIAGADPAWDVYEELLGLGTKLWVDAGINSRARAEELARFAAEGRALARIIAGLESLASREMLDELAETIGHHRLVFSLDLKSGRPLTEIPDWHNAAPDQIAAEAIARGVRRMIVLDLADVGLGQGPGSHALCQAIRTRHADIELIAGGGVRHADDLARLAASGCDAALVASALHDGRLTAEDVRR